MTMMEIIGRGLLKNRTIASNDCSEFIQTLSKEVPLTVHRYPSGSEYSTWVIPPRWEVRKALLSDGEQTLASYDDHPLFLAPYSQSFTGWISREELLRHVRTKPELPDVYLYEFRLAYNFQKRLKDWAISLPYNLVQKLDKPRYYVDIEVDTPPGEMLVAESNIPGQNKFTFSMLTHLCHVGQANDGLAGVAVGIEVMKRLREIYPHPTYTYQLLIMPETIGSSVYLSAYEDRVKDYLGSVFIEMAGIRSPLRFGQTRRADTYLDRVMKYVIAERGGDYSTSDFRNHWGNDELVFDSPGIGVPGAAIERYPFPWYHTSGDNLDQTDNASLEEVVEVLLETIRVFESDFIPRPTQQVPPYLTRYNLYADWENERSQHDRNGLILQLLWGGMSVFDIATYLKIPFKETHRYVMQFVENKLIEQIPLSPEYFRRSWDEVWKGAVNI